MTKDEILALIDAKIAGQGNAVDQGGALAEVLREIVEMGPKILKPVLGPYTSLYDSIEAFMEDWGITREQFNTLIAGGYDKIEWPDGSEIKYTLSFCGRMHQDNTNSGALYYGYEFSGGDIDASYGIAIAYDLINGTVSVIEQDL